MINQLFWNTCTLDVPSPWKQRAASIETAAAADEAEGVGWARGSTWVCPWLAAPGGRLHGELGGEALPGSLVNNIHLISGMLPHLAVATVASDPRTPTEGTR